MLGDCLTVKCTHNTQYFLVGKWCGHVVQWAKAKMIRDDSKSRIWDQNMRISVWDHVSSQTTPIQDPRWKHRQFSSVCMLLYWYHTHESWPVSFLHSTQKWVWSTFHKAYNLTVNNVRWYFLKEMLYWFSVLYSVNHQEMHWHARGCIRWPNSCHFWVLHKSGSKTHLTIVSEGYSNGDVERLFLVLCALLHHKGELDGQTIIIYGF